MASLFSLTALGFALISIAQVSNSLLITRTVHRSCSITTTATLPACGWISASGSSRPYCFPTTAPSQSSALSQSSPGIPTSSSRATSTVVLAPLYSTPPAISSSRFVISVTVTPFQSSSDTSSFASSSTSVVLVTVTPLPSVSSTASSSLLLPPVYTAPAVVTTTTTTNAASINTIPTSTTSLLPPPIYTSQPSSLNTLPSSSLTTIVTIISPPDYENPSTSSPSALLPPGYGNPSTTTSSAIPPPGYENPSTTAITSSQSSIPTDVGYCFRDGALLDVNVNVTITDNLGGVYVLLCTSTSLGVSIRGGNFLGSAQAPNSVDDCFPICDANPNCTGFTFQSIAPWGVGPGACSFYQGVGLFFDAVAEADLIAFIRVPLWSSRGIDDGWGGMMRTRRTIRDAV